LLKKINTGEPVRKKGYLPPKGPDKGFKGSMVNRALASLHGHLNYTCSPFKNVNIPVHSLYHESSSKMS